MTCQPLPQARESRRWPRCSTSLGQRRSALVGPRNTRETMKPSVHHPARAPREEEAGVDVGPGGRRSRLIIT